MPPDLPSVRYAARPVAAVMLVVLAVVLAFSSMVTSGASAEPGADETSTSSETATADDTPTDGESSDEPTDAPTDEPTDGEPTDGEPTDGETSDEPSETPTDEPTAMEVEGAVFRWGINNQTNAHSHNPMADAFNFMSAGVANPGRGGATLPKGKWHARQGNVTIQKWDGQRWKQATWAGLNKDANGQKTNSSSIFSGHNVVITKGTGTVDAANRQAEITWNGTFTVLYYGGNTMFTVSDPVLSVDGGSGVVTAELGGYATSRDDGGWRKVTPKRVTIATLAKVDFSQEKGFTVTPTYLGVKTNGSASQDRSGEFAGSFPQSMISFLAGMEVDQFWYSTGLSTDNTKVPLPLSISYDAKAQVEPTPTTEPTDNAPTVDNPVNDAPDVAQAAPQPDQQVAADDPAAAPGLPAVVPESQRELLTPADLGAVRPVAATTSEGAGPDRTWWLVGSLLLVAALLLLVPARPRG